MDGLQGEMGLPWKLPPQQFRHLQAHGASDWEAFVSNVSRGMTQGELEAVKVMAQASMTSVDTWVQHYNKQTGLFRAISTVTKALELWRQERVFQAHRLVPGFTSLPPTSCGAMGTQPAPCCTRWASSTQPLLPASTISWGNRNLSSRSL